MNVQTVLAGTLTGEEVPFALNGNNGEGFTADSEGQIVPPDNNQYFYPAPAYGYMFLSFADSQNKPHFPTRATFRFEGDGDIGIDYQPYYNTNGQFSLVLNPNDPSVAANGWYIQLVRSNPANPLKHLKYWLPGYDNAWAIDNTQPLGYRGNTLTSAYIDHLKPFNTLRYMDDMRSNGTPLVDWSDRPTLNSAIITNTASWNPVGDPYEILIEEANRTNTNPWVNIPYLANDNYVVNFAQYLHDHLNPGLTPYVEYSNEMWNWGFPQAQWQIGRDSLTPLHGSFFGQTDWYSYRSEQIFRLFDTVYGTDSKNYNRVIAGQFYWADRQNFLLQSAVSYSGGHDAADVLAVAPYFGGPPAINLNGSFAISAGDYKTYIDSTFDAVANPNPIVVTMQQYESAMSKSLDIDMVPVVAQNVAIAQRFGVRLVAYESGQTLVGWNDPVILAMFLAINRDPAIYDIYTKYLNLWFAGGGSNFNLYNDSDGPYGGYGSWGHTEFLSYNDANNNYVPTNLHDKTVAPKYAAVLDFIETHQ